MIPEAGRWGRQDDRMGVEHVRVADDGGFDMLCDCGAVTHVHVRVEGPTGVDVSEWHVPGGEFAVTCDGCGRTHWFRVHGFRRDSE